MSKKRMLEEHAAGEGSHEKRSKKQEQGVDSSANASGKAVASDPHPAAAKKPLKARALCGHQLARSICKECSGDVARPLDGQEVAAARKKRMLDERAAAGEAGGKRRSSPSNGPAAALAAHPSAAKKPRPTLCEHQRVRSRC